MSVLSLAREKSDVRNAVAKGPVGCRSRTCRSLHSSKCQVAN